MANKFKKALLLFLIIFLIVNYAYARDGNDNDDKDKAQEAINNQGSYSGTLPANTQITLPGGGTATVSGNVQVAGGQIKSADKIDYGSASIKDATDFQ